MKPARWPVLAAVAVLVALGVVAPPGASLAQGAAGAPPPASAPDPFYLSLLRDGRSEMLRGDPLAAKKSFRLACFGFLEQPVILAEGLVRLALAEAALNDRETFVETFSRFAEVEERFQAYAPAALTADERRAFEDKVLEWVPPETLRALPVFAPLLARKNEVDLARLTPRERTRELEKRAAAEPAEPRFKVLLAADDLAGDRAAKALARLDGVADTAENGSAGCLRGRALAGLERCEEAIVPLAACAGATADALLAEAQIGCLVTLGRSDAARDFAARLAKPAVDAPAVRKAVSRIPPPPKTPKLDAAATPAVPPQPRPGKPATPPQDTAKVEKEPAKEVSPPKPAAAGKAPVPATVPPAPKPASGPAPRPAGAAALPPASKAGAALTPAEEGEVSQARGLLRTVDDREELQRGLERFQPVADRFPGRSDLQLLAGEIAYRAGQWATGASYLKRSSPDLRGPTDPTLRFYYAVCLFEAGETAEAAKVASTGLEKLQRPPFVESYLARIHAAHP